MIDDQPLGDLPRDVRAQVILHQGQRKVDARRHPRRGPDPPVVGEDTIFLHVDLWVPGLQLSSVEPVGRGPAAIEDTSLRQDERTGADRRHATRPRGFAAQVGKHGFAGRRDRRRARDQQRVVRARQSLR